MTNKEACILAHKIRRETGCTLAEAFKQAYHPVVPAERVYSLRRAVWYNPTVRHSSSVLDNKGNTRKFTLEEAKAYAAEYFAEYPEDKYVPGRTSRISYFKIYKGKEYIETLTR